MRGTCHGASGQRAPQKTQMDAQKNRPLSPESLSERWQQQWQHFITELIQWLQEPKVEFLWGDETAVYDDWIRAAMSAQMVFAPWCFEGSLDSDKMLQWLQQLRP
jgi:hypothetical protein